MALRGVAVITGSGGHGSGFLAAPGVLVTNYHVVADEVTGSLTAAFPDNRDVSGREFSLEVLHEDPLNDLAFLGIDVDIPHLVPRLGFRHRNGHRIVAIGSPGIGAGGGRLENLTTDGRLGPLFEDAGGPTLWALSMTVNPGNSGGPIVDAATGEVLGVVVAKFTDTEGHSLAVPHENLMAGLERAMAVGRSDASAAAASLHRQRYCLRSTARLIDAASVAVHQLLTEMSSLSESGSDAVHSVVCSFTDGIGRGLSEAAASIKPTIDGELTLLRSDGQCPAPTRTALERAWGGTERLTRQLASDVGRLEVESFADDIRMALDRARGLLDSLQADLLGPAGGN